MSDRSSTRRHVLRTAGTAAAGTLAGCSVLGGGGDSSDDGPSFDAASAGAFDQFQYDAGNSGYVPHGSVGADPQRHWKFQEGSTGPGYGVGNPCVAGETVYVTETSDDVGAFGTTAYALDLADGSVEWSTSVPLQTSSQLSTSGELVIGQALNVVGIDQSGEIVWQLDDTDFLWPLAIDDGLGVGVDLSADPTSLVGIDLSNGRRQWSADGRVFAWAPAIDGEQVYVGGNDLYAYGVGGERRWAAGLDAGVEATPTAHDGTVFAPGSDGTVTALDADGEVLWEATVERSPRSRGFGGIGSSPATDGDRLYVQFGGRLTALDVDDGTEVWHADIGLGNPPVVTDDAVLVAFVDELRCVDSATGDVRWRYGTGGESGGRPVPAVVDGAVAVPGRGLHLLTF